MTHPLPILILSLAFTLPLMAQQPRQVFTPAVRRAGNALDVSFGGKTRLAAGGPRFESGTPAFTDVTVGGDVFSFHAGAERVDVTVKPDSEPGVISFFVSPSGASRRKADE
jgi:hypothetical protein